MSPVAGTAELVVNPFLAEEILRESLVFDQFPARHVDADTIPELRSARQEAKEQTARILEGHMQSLREGSYDSVPIPVNALSNAARAVEAGNRYGQESQAHLDAYESLRVDCQRLLAEAMRKNTWEYFPELRQDYDHEQQSYTFYGRSLLDIVAAGVTPVVEAEEVDRRKNEYTEEITYKALGGMALKGLISGDMRVTTISECPDWAIDVHARSSRGGYGGYVPEINKFMVRTVRFDAAKNCRYEEQLGMSGQHVTHEIIIEALQILGAVDPGEAPSKTEVHAKQLINYDGEGAIDFARLVDGLASETSGKNIFMGEEVASDFVKNYAALPALAEARQHELVQHSKTVADYLTVLAANNIDPWAAEGLVEVFVQKLLFQEVKHDYEKTAMVFDVATAEGLREVADLRMAGMFAEAQQLEQTIEENAPPVSFCGAGSCGLEKVGLATGDDREAKKLLGADAKDMLRDTERSCKECGAKKLYYDAKKVNTACTGCKSTKIDGILTIGKKTAKK